MQIKHFVNGEWVEIRQNKLAEAFEHAAAHGSEFAKDLYKIATNNQGHIISASPVTKSDLTEYGLLDSDSVASNYNENDSYTAGEFVIYDGKLYKALENCGPESFNPSKWEAANILIAAGSGGTVVSGEADWNAQEGEPGYIKNKPTSPSGGAVDSVNGKTGVVVLNAEDVGALSNDISIPTKTSDLIDDSNFISDANYVHTDNNYTNADKTKLAGIEAGATVDDKTWNGVTLSTSATYTSADQYIPVKSTNQLNGTAFQNILTETPTAYGVAKYDNNAHLKSTTPANDDNSTKVATTAFVNNAISSLGSVLNYKGTKPTVGDLPQTGNTAGDIWIIESDGSQYIWNGTSWDNFSSTIDLSGYVQTSRTINGKALSENISLNASDVGALSDAVVVPSKTSDLTNDSGFITNSSLSDYMQKGVDYVTAGRKPGTTLGDYSTAEGRDTTASGESSHAEGDGTYAYGMASHAEGVGSRAYGSGHAEGTYTTAGDNSHAEGSATVAYSSSHSEGGGTTARGEFSHAEGHNTTASGDTSHAEGNGTTANHKAQHVFGEYNAVDTNTSSARLRGDYVEIVGNGTEDNARSNARTLDWDGNETLAGKLTVGVGPTNNMDVTTKQYVDTVVENVAALPSQTGNSGKFLTTNGTTTSWTDNPPEIFWVNITTNDHITATADKTYAEIIAAINAGKYPIISSPDLIDPMNDTNVLYPFDCVSSGDPYTIDISFIRFSTRGFDYAYGSETNRYYCTNPKISSILFYSDNVIEIVPTIELTARGDLSSYMQKGVDYVTAGKRITSTLGTAATAEGYYVIASGNYSHAEGNGSIASGNYSHAEGQYSTASGTISHAEGQSTTASGMDSHAEGALTVASGVTSHAEGAHTIANHRAQHVFGEYNVEDTNTASNDIRGDYVEIVGNGSVDTRSNARTLDWSGNETLAGKLTVGAAPVNDMDVATKVYVDTIANSFSSGADWAAAENETGYIANKPFYSNIDSESVYQGNDVVFRYNGNKIGGV